MREEMECIREEIEREEESEAFSRPQGWWVPTNYKEVRCERNSRFMSPRRKMQCNVRSMKCMREENEREEEGKK